MEKLKTHIESVDNILDGGIPQYAVTVISGGPGTGKTVLTMQTMFNNAKKGLKCLYFTTLSEPVPKLVRNMEQFEFFDESLVGSKLKFIDLGTALRNGGPQQALAQVVEVVEAEQPDIVAIDSFKAIHDLSPDIESARIFVYDLAVHLSIWAVTTFLVGEYTPEDISTSPEFAIADAIFSMVFEQRELMRLREFEVLKLRGSDFNNGRHYFDISPAGIRVYPRIGSIEEDEVIESAERVASGIPGLDEMLHGGLPAASTTLIAGATGVGKTLVSLSFMAQGAKQGEKGIIFSLEERPAQTRAVAAGLGIDLTGVEIFYTSPIELIGSKWLAEARDIVERTGAKRVVVDSLSAMMMGALDERRFRELVYTAVKMFRTMGVTLIMTIEVPELLASAIMAGHGISSISDNIILLRYVEVESRLQRAVAVLKIRGSSHETELRKYTISSEGINVDGPFERYRGVLAGLPTPLEQ